MYLPSGDHEGLVLMPQPPRLRRPRPSASTTVSRSRVETYAIRRPEGDHAGALASYRVKRFKEPPSVFR
jgi:hypothetical protein